MPMPYNNQQTLDLQQDWSGGMNELPNAPQNTYTYGRNIEIRNGRAATRRAVKATYPRLGALAVGFYFNQENYKSNDAGHTGFWFDFDFAREVNGTGSVQGSAVIKKFEWPDSRFIYCVNGEVFVVSDGFSTFVPTRYTIDSDETVYFVQAANKVYLFRDGDEDDLYPMVWDFSSAGFVAVPAPDEQSSGLSWDSAPQGRNPVYHLGRLWVWVNDDEIVASDILSFNNWDTSLRNYAVNYGDGNKGTAITPMGRNELLVCKDRSISILSNLSDPELENIARYTMSQNIGVVGEGAIASDGSQAWIMSYDGIYYIFRNEYGQLQMSNAPISLGIQSLIDRINWPQAHKIHAATDENYVLFSVPMDGSTENNAMIVYDRLLRVFVGIWDGELVRAKQFMLRDGELHFITPEGRIKQFFCDDYVDSQTPDEDFPPYSSTEWYYAGRIVEDEGRVWKCLKRNKTVSTDDGTVTTHAPEEGDYWTEVSDAYAEANIVTQITTRFLNFGDDTSDKDVDAVELVFSHINPKLSVYREDEDPYDTDSIYSDITYDKTKYDVDGKADWVESNTNLDHDTPDRQDYDVRIPETGIYMDTGGIYVFAHEHHSLRWVPWSVNQRASRYRIINTLGRIELKHLAVLGSHTAFANRER